MDRTLASVEFSHPALRGASPVTVRQNLDAPSAEEEGTARWVWPGATATARWLCDRDRGRWLENKHVLELGSGTGLLGLVAARLGAASVTLTDLPSELDLLRANVALNSIAASSPTRVEPLVWGDETGMLQLIDRARLPSGFDVVLCCDLVYRNGDEHQRALARTMRRAMGDAFEGAEDATSETKKKQSRRASRLWRTSFGKTFSATLRSSTRSTSCSPTREGTTRKTRTCGCSSTGRRRNGRGLPVAER